MPILNQTSVFELDMGTPTWRKTYGIPRYWAPDGLDWFAVSPSPRGGNFILEGYKEPPTLDREKDFIDLEDSELVRILDYAHWYISFKEGPDEALANTQNLVQNMIQAAGLRNAWLRRSAMYREYMGQHRDELQVPSTYPERKTGVRKP